MTPLLFNIYGYNCSQLNKLLFAEISSKTKLLSDKYTESTIILGGDFNECMDGTIDRFPPRLNQNSISNNLILNLTSDLSLSDAWRFFNPDFIDFTWFNNTLTLKSRIDLFLISQSALSSVIDVKHSPAPLTDHKLVTVKLGQQHNKPGIRGYWKFNNSLLNDEEFNDGIKELVKEIFTDCNDGFKQKWEFFKYKARLIATERCRVIKARRNKLETELMQHLNRLTKTNNTEEEKLEIKKICLQLDDLYLNLARGAFVRSKAKWLEEGEKNSNYFFALEKRNGQRKMLTSLNIEGNICNDATLISNL